MNVVRLGRGVVMVQGDVVRLGRGMVGLMQWWGRGEVGSWCGDDGAV